MILDDNGEPVPAAMIVDVDNVIKALRKAYPRWADQWHIIVDTKETVGMMYIRSHLIGGDHGVQVPLLEVHKSTAKIVTMCGELFERYGIPRKKNVDIPQALADIKRTGYGSPIHEV